MKITAKKIAKLYDLPIDFAKSYAPFFSKIITYFCAHSTFNELR